MLMLAATVASPAQVTGGGVRVEGRFVQDSLKVGEPVRYGLTVTYPPDVTVLLPDSAYDYEPFYYLRRQYYPTFRRDSLLVDSVVYLMTTFELDGRQGLSIPAIRVQDTDSTYMEPRADSIYLKRTVTVLPDTVNLREQADLEPVEDKTNWPLIYLVAGILLVVLVVAALALARPLQRWYRLRTLRRDHARFREQFDAQAGLPNGNPADPEGALATWKRYLERLDARPYAKMTTREISEVRPEPDLRQALRDIDRHIYGGQSYNGEHTESYRVLVRIVEERYERKLKEVKK